MLSHRRYSVNIAIESNTSDTLIIVWGQDKKPSANFNQFTSEIKHFRASEDILLLNFDKNEITAVANKPTMHLLEVHCSLYEEGGIFSEMTKTPVSFYEHLGLFPFKNSTISYSAFLVKSRAPLHIEPLSPEITLQQKIIDYLEKSIY